MTREDWAIRIVKTVAVAGVLCSLFTMGWASDTLHDIDITLRWLTLISIGMLIGPFAMVYILCEIGVQGENRVSTPEVRLVMALDEQD